MNVDFYLKARKEHVWNNMSADFVGWKVKRSIDLHVQQEIIHLGSLLLKMKRPRPEN